MSRREVHGLPLAHYLGVLAAAVLVFLFGGGPAWLSPYRLDTGIYASYAIIPVLVALLLSFRRAFSWGRFLLASVELLLLKYGATLSLAALLWATHDPPAPAPPPKLDPPAARAPEPLTVIAPGSTGRIKGRVLGEDGQPRRDALVLVARGLEGVHLAGPKDPLRIANDGAGFSPRLAVLHQDQPLLLVRTDRSLHTASGLGEHGSPLFALPVLDEVHARPVVLGRALSRVRLRCKVHPGEAERAELWVLSHGFFTRTSSAGGFALEGVPAGSLELFAGDGAHEARAALELRPGRTATVTLALRAQPSIWKESPAEKKE